MLRFSGVEAWCSGELSFFSGKKSFFSGKWRQVSGQIVKKWVCAGLLSGDGERGADLTLIGPVGNLRPARQAFSDDWVDAHSTLTKSVPVRPKVSG
jgi:hypothetical protein